MRIAEVVNSFPNIPETFILNQVTGLLDLGHVVDIYALRRPKPGPVHPQVESYKLQERVTYLSSTEATRYRSKARHWIEIARKGSKEFRRAPVATCRVVNPFARPHWAYLTALDHLSTVLSAPVNRYDIIHCQFGNLGARFHYLKDLWRSKLVVSFRGFDFQELPRVHGDRVYQPLFKAADLITVNSEYTRAEVLKLGCPSGKIIKHHSGINPDSFPWGPKVIGPDGSIRILSIARLVEKKGLEWSIRAISKVIEKHPAVSYDIIGDGPLKHKLEALIQDLNLQRSIRILGAQPSDEVRRRLAKAHIFVMPSIEEPLGVAAMEAQASWLPVVCASVGGLPEVIVDGESGYLVPPRDEGALAEPILYLIEHPNTWPEMGRNGRRHVEENFDIRKLNRRLVSIYESLLSGEPISDQRLAAADASPLSVFEGDVR